MQENPTERINNKEKIIGKMKSWRKSRGKEIKKEMFKETNRRGIHKAEKYANFPVLV